MVAIVPSRISERVNAGPVHVTAEELAPLTWFERASFRWCNLVNSNATVRRIAQVFRSRIGAGWVFVCTRNIVHLHGTENLQALPKGTPLLVCANHRSFFDMYVLTCWMSRVMDHMPNIVFPVRANFFYENPLGVFVNMLMSAFAMYPPIFRQAEKRGFNAYALARTVELARTPDTMVGFHPEGTRGKGPDPYQMLPAQPGVGQIIYEAQPTVLPVFINGLGNNVLRQVVSNFTGGGAPVHIVFGPPLDVTSFYAKPNRLRTHKELSDYVAAEIARLGAVERELRANHSQPSASEPSPSEPSQPSRI